MPSPYKQTICIMVQTTDDPTVYGVPKLAPAGYRRDRYTGTVDLAKFLERVASGQGTGHTSVFVEGVDGTAATGTVTVGVGNAAALDTVTLAGVVFTFKAAASCDPSTVTDVALGATPLLSGTNLVNNANKHATVRGIGSFAVSGTTTGIATWTANFACQAANTYGTIAVVGANLTRSGATIASGTESTFKGAGFFAGDGP